MAAQPPIQLGQISPDGLWRWDGARWVPVGEVVPPRSAPPRSRRWLWWVAGGCAVLLVLGVGGVVGIISLANTFQRGGFTCLPADFPGYPGTSVSSQRTYVGTGVAPGDTKSCTITLQSNDDVATVTAFYYDKLGSNDWKVTNFDSSSGQIKFQRVSKPLTVGLVELLGRGQHTEIRIQLDS